MPPNANGRNAYGEFSTGFFYPNCRYAFNDKQSSGREAFTDVVIGLDVYV